jgi:hypothetical protein
MLMKAGTVQDRGHEALHRSAQLIHLGVELFHFGPCRTLGLLLGAALGIDPRRLNRFRPPTQIDFPHPLSLSDAPVVIASALTVFPAHEGCATCARDAGSGIRFASLFDTP